MASNSCAKLDIKAVKAMIAEMINFFIFPWFLKLFDMLIDFKCKYRNKTKNLSLSTMLP